MIKIMSLFLNFPPVKFGNASYTLVMWLERYTLAVYIYSKRKDSVTRKTQTKTHLNKHK